MRLRTRLRHFAPRASQRPHTFRLDTHNRTLHSSQHITATPLPGAAPGPPPKPPVAAPSFPPDRIARSKRQAELLELGKQLRGQEATKPGQALRKRFWKDVSVKETADGHQIFLDTRPVRTPSKTVLSIPHSKPHLATGIALEWDKLVTAHQALKQHYIPLTSLAARAIHIALADQAGDTKVRDSVVNDIMGFLRTDTALCWAPRPTLAPSLDFQTHQTQEANQQPPETSLRELQMASARPLIAYLTRHVWPGVELDPVLADDSILPTPQPEMTQQVVRGWVAGLPSWELAGMERAALASKSLCIAARLVVEWSGEFADVRAGAAAGEGGRFTIEEAARACSLEVAWQTGMWGEVEDTHDVNHEDLRAQLGSVVLLVSSSE